MEIPIDDQVTKPVQKYSPPPNLPVDNTPQTPGPAMPDIPPIPPQQPAYSTPTLDYSVQPEKRNNSSMVTTVVAVVAVIVIILLAGLLYYFATKTYPSAPISVNTSSKNTTKKPAEKKPEIPAVPVTPVAPVGPATNIITFATPAVLPTIVKQGSCTAGSIAAAERKDAFRCSVGTINYDPCFTTDQANTVFCQMNPISPATTAFLIKSAKPLPKITLPDKIPDNWAWFVKLSDGTICSPITGPEPIINGVAGVYGCRPPDKTHQIVLGALTKGQEWTAQEFISTLQGKAWVQSSTVTVKVDTVWQ